MVLILLPIGRAIGDMNFKLSNYC